MLGAELEDLAVAFFERAEDAWARSVHFADQDEPGQAFIQGQVAYGLYLVSEVLLTLAETEGPK